MRIRAIKENDVINGEGINVSVWTQGCEHHCKGCFNQETWNPNKGEEFTEEHFNKIVDALDKNGIRRNLSILGGDPLYPGNIDGVLELCERIKALDSNRTIYLWTGYLFEHLVAKYGSERFGCIDYLIDGKFEEDKKDLRLLLRGSSNQRVIDVQSSLKNNEIVLYT